MLPFLVDKNWFEDWWYRDRVGPKRQAPAMRLTRFAVCIVLVVGSAVVVGQLHSGDRASDAHIRHAGSLME